MTITWTQIKATIVDGHIDWEDFFDERQMKEIKFDQIYAADFHHGTDGHNARLIIATMAELLSRIADNIEFKADDK